MLNPAPEEAGDTVEDVGLGDGRDKDGEEGEGNHNANRPPPLRRRLS